MAYENNPFTPTFGEIPAHLAGRQGVIRDVERAFKSEQRRPELTSIFSGARGMGKTTLLSVLASRAKANGWIAVEVTALDGMLDEIEVQLNENAAHLVEAEGSKKLSGIEIAQVGALSFQNVDKKSTWRSRVSKTISALNELGTGVLITVDEVDPKLDEMVQLAASYQHFVREGRKVALLMAGLSQHISNLLNDKTVSFLRRAQGSHLGRVADYEVKEALSKTISENGRSIEERNLDLAAQAIDGFPFLIQLVGYRMWDVSPDCEAISRDDVERGVELARAEMSDRILEATYRELSEEDKNFLVAMLADEDVTRTSALAQRLGKKPQQISQYRRRLIDAGVIGERGRGLVGFELPYFREYLEELQ